MDHEETTIGGVFVISRAWMLDPIEFHHEFDSLSDSMTTQDGIDRLREKATALWRCDDPLVHAYVDLLRTATPDEWEAGFDENHLVDWYRILMAPFLIPIRAFHSPDHLRRRLPDLGWTPSEARRLARGRELQLLLDRFGSQELVPRLSIHLGLGNKGWLSQDDLEAALVTMRSLDRSVFKDNQELVPLIENAYEVLEAGVTKPDHILLMVSD